MQLSDSRRRSAVLFLLDYRPRSWESKDEYHFRLAQKLIARDLQPIFFFSEPPSDTARTRFESIGAQVHSAPYEPDRIAYSGQIGRICKEFDVRLLHLRYFNYFTLLPWIARFHGIRNIVFTEANSGEFRATGLKRTLLQLRARTLTQPMSRVIGISHYIRDGLAHAGVAEDKLRVVYNGIDTDLHGPEPAARNEIRQQYGIKPEELLLLIVADFRPMKNHDVILSALARIEQPCKLLLAGKGPLREQLEAQAKALGIEDRVIWLGYYKGPQKLMQGSDVFLLPSVGEAFGFSIAEAMCCGMPVIGGASGAIPEIVKDGETGFVVAPRDPDAIADAIRKLAADPELRRRLGSAARKRVETEFHMDLAVDRTLAVYDEIWDEAPVAARALTATSVR